VKEFLGEETLATPRRDRKITLKTVLRDIYLEDVTSSFFLTALVRKGIQQWNSVPIRHELYSLPQTLELRVRIPLKARMSV
jgi:hypothetical protein